MKIAWLINFTAMVVSAGGPAGDYKRFDDACEHFRAGYYRYAYEEFESVAASRQEGLAGRAVVARADCQMAWGGYEEALTTLDENAERSARSADWHRAAAAVHFRLGHYDEAIESGRQALVLDPDLTRARYELGRVYEALGRRGEALETYGPFNELLTAPDAFPDTAADAHYAGLGFYRYSVLASVDNLARRTRYVLQDVLQPACEVLDLTYWPARLGIADLLMEKYNLVEALGDYRAVLKRNPHCLDAHLGLGKIALEGWDFENVERRVDVCLDIDPRSAEASVLLAKLRMAERRFEDAAAAAQAALQVNPNHIEALSYLAAAQLRASLYDAAEQTTQRVYQLSATPAVLHTILGQQLYSGRQFPEAEAELVKAIELDPTAALPRNELAMMYMQWGFEDKAREVVGAALDVDAFNARTFFTERLLDDLGKFASHTSPNFEVHFDEKHDAVLGEYASDYLESIYEELREDYETELEHKTIIEFFPDHRRFGVRIHGKPWIHTVGACTGRVIAMDAPRPDVQGNYNFAGVLRHEFTHTVTLAATRNRIPHWLTEGLAVLQEDRPRPWRWRTMLVDRLRRDELFDLQTIDWGFARPRKPDDRQVAYAQSEWMCEFLIEQFGYEVINRQLRMYREGRTQQEVIPAVTGMSLEQFDRRFQEWARRQAAEWGLPLDPLPDPRAVRLLLRFYAQSAALRAHQARILIDRQSYADALEQAGQALELEPDHAAALQAAGRASFYLANRQPSPHLQMQLFEQAADYYQRLAEHHPDDPAAAEFLAEWSYKNKDHEAALRRATALKELQPLNPASYRILSGIHLEGNDDDAALPELLELARYEDHDADVPRQIARIYKRRGKLRAAASWYLSSIFIDPYDVGTHRLFGQLLDELGESRQAIREYRVLTLLEPDEAVHLNELAFAYYRAGLLDEARQAARKAVTLDPQSPASQLIEDSGARIED